MELTEALQRIVRHWRMILAVIIMVMAAPIVANALGDDTYVASARLTIGPDTTNASQAEALVDTAKGIITSPGQLKAAVEVLEVYRDPEQLAQNQIRIESVGSSGVLILSVSDRDPGVAASLANVLSDQLLETRSAQLVDPLEQQLADLNDELVDVGIEINSIEAAANRSDSSIDALRLQLDDALRRRTEIWTQREVVSEALDAAPKPVLIDPATVPDTPEAGSLVADLLVAGLLGLVLGIGLVAIIETLRPSIVGSDALSRALKVPVLGQISSPPHGRRTIDDDWLLHNLGMASRVAGVDAVQLAGLAGDLDLKDIATQIRVSSLQVRFSSVAAAAMPMQGLSVDVLGSNGNDPQSRGLRLEQTQRTGIVAVAPRVLSRATVSDLEHLVAITGWPLLGIISFTRSGHEHIQEPSPVVGKPPESPPKVPAQTPEVQVQLIAAEAMSPEPWS